MTSRTISCRRTRLLADSALVFAGLIWGSSFVVHKFAIGIMPPMFYLGARFIVACAVLTLVFHRRVLSLTWGQLRASATVGLILFAGFAFHMGGLVRTSPGLAGFLSSLYVVLVPLILGLWTGRWPRLGVAAGITLVVCGMGLLMVSGGVAFGLGEMLTLIATLFWALHVLAVGRTAPRVDPFALSAVQLGLAGLLAMVWSLLTEPPMLFPGWMSLGTILYAALTGGVVGYVLMMWAQRHTPPTEAGLLVGLEAVAALAFAVALGYDTVSPRSILGFAIILAGTTVSQLSSHGRTGALSEGPVAIAPLAQIEEHLLAPAVEDEGLGESPEVAARVSAGLPADHR